jgi:fatty acid desaturase
MSRTKKISHNHHHLKHPDDQPLIYEHFIAAMSDESKALLFTILVLSCIFLVFGLFNLFLNNPKTQSFLPADTTPVINEIIEKSPNYLPRT